MRVLRWIRELSWASLDARPYSDMPPWQWYESVVPLSVADQ